MGTERFSEKAKFLVSSNRGGFAAYAGLLALGACIGGIPQDSAWAGLAFFSVPVMFATFAWGISIRLKWFRECFKTRYGEHDFGDFAGIALPALKVYAVNFLLAMLFSVLPSVAGGIFLSAKLFENHPELAAMGPEEMQAALPDYMGPYMPGIIGTVGPLVLIVFAAVFFRLLYVEHLLVFRRESYRSKDIVRESREYIQRGRKTAFLAFFGLKGAAIAAGILPLLWPHPLLMTFRAAVSIAAEMLFFLVLLVKFTDLKAAEEAA